MCINHWAFQQQAVLVAHESRVSEDFSYAINLILAFAQFSDLRTVGTFDWHHK